MLVVLPGEAFSNLSAVDPGSIPSLVSETLLFKSELGLNPSFCFIIPKLATDGMLSVLARCSLVAHSIFSPSNSCAKDNFLAPTSG